MNNIFISSFTLMLSIIPVAKCIEVEINNLVTRNDLIFLQFTDVPFSGRVKGNVTGLILEGMKQGSWSYYTEDTKILHKVFYKDGQIADHFVG